MKKRYKQIISLFMLIVILVVSFDSVAYAASESDLIEYLSKCRFFPSYGTLVLTERTYLKYLPCSKKTNSTSTDVAVYEAGKSLTVTGLYINTEGNYWYRVTDGSTQGYVFNTYGSFEGNSPNISYYFVANKQLYISDETKHICYAVSTPSASTITISKDQIDAICRAFGFENNTYWVYNEGRDKENHPMLPYDWYVASSDSSYHTSYQEGSGKTLSYCCGGCYECAGFVNFMGLMLTGQMPKNGDVNNASTNIGSGWTSYSTTQIKNLGGVKPGDIIRNSGHSAMVYSVNNDGSFNTIEVWGGSANVIRIGEGFNKNGSSKLDQIPGIIYVLRYDG